MARMLVAVMAFCLLALGASPGAHAAKRVAFVVGIDAYDNLTEQQQLKKAVNDAQAVGAALAGLGYDVQKADNVGRLDFLRQWQLFLNRLEPGDEAAVFFAGHGVEIDGQNFLLPRDVPRVESGEEEVLKASGLSLASLLDQVRDRHPQVGLYILDACRDNPFVDGKGRGIGGTRGLARVEPPSGTFIMFSAGAKESALDRLSDNDPNPNSVYTRTLLPRLKAFGRITDIARDVRREVRELAASVAHVQTPAYYDEVVGDFCPAGCEAKTAAVPAEPVPSERPPAAQPQAAPAAAPAEAAAPQTPAPPPVKLATFTPRAIQPLAPGRPPVSDCDRLAVDPSNPDSVIAAPENSSYDWARAIAACKEVADAHPDERRFAFQLARAYVMANQPELAKPLLETLSDSGYSIATTYLGYLHAGGRAVPKDEAEALRLYRQASAAGDQLGTSSVGGAYERGIGVGKDEAQAIRWYEKAAGMGSPGATLRLGDAYAKGQLGLTKDGIQAAEWYRKAAELGSVEGVYRLGLLYREGLGLPKDENEAARLFALGDAEKRSTAMVDVGYLLLDGEGVGKDEQEALKWFRKAADLGDRNGIFSVALRYRYGGGVPKDGAEAIRWYRKAAEQGYALAMTSLADMYRSGDGVPKDAAEAKRWRAAANAAERTSSSAGQVSASLANVPLLRSFAPDEYEPSSLVFAPAGNPLYVLFSGGYIKPFDVDNGAVGEEFGIAEEGRPCCKLVVSSDGRYLASGNYDNLVMLWDAKTGASLKTFKGHTDDVAAVAISPDGKLLASGGDDKAIKLWDIESGKLLHTLDGHTDRINALTFSPDGALLASGGWDQSIKFWDVAAGSLIESLPGHAGMVISLAFSGDGTRLVSAGADSRIRVWDVTARKEMVNFGAGITSLCCAAISPDGKVVASGSSGGVVRLWDTKTGTLIANLNHDNEIRAVAFSPDGSTLATGSDDKLVQLWDLRSAEEARR